ncbi:hypothetical protein ACUN18_28840 [Bacillus cereus group sp. Bce030]|uniref:hypothetical protein n=1 Tax=Bacillus cereus group TaxID=86661 RepID=UPI0002798360|nr:hypothetical protein [Bacillus paranthracis]EJP82054.1 hypothetical protein IAU_05901 [Bacillus cereus IS075]EOO82010.1 hypothetical protein IGS_06012 [Bacillus cereus IS845/00]EOO91755.1 hypothetical protein IGQ_06028 [Bacillus cereus IS195]HEF5705969.1 hypothetical protein [Bacillus paranthracis]
MAYLTAKKVKGNIYFYVAQYVGTQQYYSNKHKYKYIYPIGNQKIVLERIAMWLLDNNRIPKELLEIGVSINDVEYWHEKAQKTLQNYS